MKTKHVLAICASLATSTLRADTFGTGPNAFTIDFVIVGDPGNPVDTATTGSYFSPHGAVGYTFQMGKYEVSRDMITKANAGGSLALTLQDMAVFGGNVGTHAATGISWNEAARFVNWLNTSKSYAPAYKFMLQPGDGGYTGNEDIALWQVGETGYDASNPYRNKAAHYFLPSENEWYKAAYYSGSGSTYYDYATQQDAPSTPAGVASGTAVGSAVYDQAYLTGPADINQAGGLSHYGTMGQNGNAYELIESAYDGVNSSPSESRTVLGAYWNLPASSLSASIRNITSPTPSDFVMGFRVAAVPEPSSIVFLTGTGMGFLLRRRRDPV